MILNAENIKEQIDHGFIVIQPYSEKRLNPNSYNLRLDNELKVYRDTGLELDALKDNPVDVVEIFSTGLVLQPGELYLGATKEYTETHHHVPCVEGRSSLGRLGVSVHVTAGFGDIGFCGTWTLEITVVRPVRIYPDMEICQIFYNSCSNPLTEFRYNGRYQGQIAAEPCKLYKDRSESSS